jgi:hypothetical protein
MEEIKTPILFSRNGAHVYILTSYPPPNFFLGLQVNLKMPIPNNISLSFSYQKALLLSIKQYWQKIMRIEGIVDRELEYKNTLESYSDLQVFTLRYSES